MTQLEQDEDSNVATRKLQGGFEVVPQNRKLYAQLLFSKNVFSIFQLKFFACLEENGCLCVRM